MNILSHFDMNGSALTSSTTVLPAGRVKFADWTEEGVRKEALKYKRRWDFQNACGGAYQYAARHGILKSVCKHMPGRFMSIHSKDSIQAEALKYSTRGAFAKGSQAEYSYARKHHMLNDVCSHMVCCYAKK